MRYALFTALPFVGHLNPLLRQAEELQRRGWRVAVASTREMADHCGREAPQIPFVDLGTLGDTIKELRAAEADATVDPDYRRGGMRFLPVLAKIWPVMFDGLVATITTDRPSILVVDIFSWAGVDAADATGAVFALNNPSLLTGVPQGLLAPAPGVPMMTTGQSIHDIGRLQRAAEPLLRNLMALGIRFTVVRGVNALRRTRGLPNTTLEAPLRNRQILVNGAFGLEYVRPLPSNVAMVGPMLADDIPALPPELDRWLSDGPPVIYANLGTVSANSPEQLGRFANGIAVDGMRALWIVRPPHASRIPQPIPSNVRLMDWVPSPRAVLVHENVRVFVSHCGINSVHESLAAGTPIVGIPMLADQRDMAVRVADAGVGVWLDKSTFTTAQLRGAIMKASNDSSFRDRLPAVQDAFKRAGGVRCAADLIERAAAAQ